MNTNMGLKCKMFLSLQAPNEGYDIGVNSESYIYNKSICSMNQRAQWRRIIYIADPM